MSATAELRPTSDNSLPQLPRAKIIRQRWQTQSPPPHEFVALLCPEEEGGFSIFALHYAGIISQGETQEEAEANIMDAFRAMLESRRKHGQRLEFSERPVVEETQGCKRIRVTIDG